jgi:dTDP-4-dehydrorhamnose 3,5-epimerase
MIDGVKVIPLDVHMDDRGYLMEIARNTHDSSSHGVVHKFGQVYLVGDMARETIRAYHKHERTWDWFCIVKGSAKFVLVDERSNSDTYGERVTIVAGERKPVLITIPPGVYHGWMSLEDNTMLISIASEPYDRQSPDEERIDPDYFGDTWAVVGR